MTTSVHSIKDPHLMQGLHAGPVMALDAVLPPETKAEAETDSDDTALQQAISDSLAEETKTTLQRDKVSKKLTALQDETDLTLKIATVRNVSGDGNCLYSALITGYIEHHLVTNHFSSNKQRAFNWKQALIKRYKKNYSRLSMEITEIEEATKKKIPVKNLLSPSRFTAYLTFIAEGSTIAEKILRLTQAFNCKEFYKTLITFTRHQCYENLESDTKTDDLETIKALTKYATDPRIIVGFAKAFNISVHYDSLTDNVTGTTLPDSQQKIAVLHDKNHFYAARLQPLQKKIEDSQCPTKGVVIGVEKQNETYTFDKSSFLMEDKGRLSIDRFETEAYTGLTRKNANSIANLLGFTGKILVHTNSWVMRNKARNHQLTRSGNAHQGITYQVDLYGDDAKLETCIKTIAQAYKGEFNLNKKDPTRCFTLTIKKGYTKALIQTWEFEFKQAGFTNLSILGPSHTSNQMQTAGLFKKARQNPGSDTSGPPGDTPTLD